MDHTIATLFQFSATSSLPGFHCTGAGSIDWHSLQFLTTARTSALVDQTHKVQLSLYTRVPSGPMNGLYLSNISFFSNSAHRLSGFRHCMDFLQPSLWHPCELISSVIMRLDQPHINLQLIFRGQLLECGEPMSD